MAAANSAMVADPKADRPGCVVVNPVARKVDLRGCAAVNPVAPRVDLRGCAADVIRSADLP